MTASIRRRDIQQSAPDAAAAHRRPAPDARHSSDEKFTLEDVIVSSRAHEGNDLDGCQAAVMPPADPDEPHASQRTMLGTPLPMTFYESNKDVRATGAEVAEFDDAAPARTREEDETRNLPGSQAPPTNDDDDAAGVDAEPLDGRSC